MVCLFAFWEKRQKRFDEMIFLLFGMTASGKTTIGKAIARLLKCQFIDLDARIVQDVNMSVRSFYTKCGKVAFQQMENNVLKKVLLQCKRDENEDFFVISTGGGLIENQDAIDFLIAIFAKESQDIAIFFLDIPAKILWKRLLKKAKKTNSFPAFLKRIEEKKTSSSKKIEPQHLYRANFLSIYKKRMSLFRKMEKKISLIKVKCKRKKVKQIAKIVIKKAKFFLTTKPVFPYKSH